MVAACTRESSAGRYATLLKRWCGTHNYFVRELCHECEKLTAVVESHLVRVQLEGIDSSGGVEMRAVEGVRSGLFLKAGRALKCNLRYAIYVPLGQTSVIRNLLYTIQKTLFDTL